VNRATGADGYPRQQEGNQQVAARVAFTEMPLDLGRPRVGGPVDERGESIGVGAEPLPPGSDGCNPIHLHE
jgi:hypothetical protein